MLLHRSGPLGGFKVRHLQLGVGGMKGHVNAAHFYHTRPVQRTCNCKPMVTLANRFARELLPEWLTWTAMQLSCNLLSRPHQHLHDSSPWSAVLSIGQHTRGHIWVEVGGLCSGQGGRRCSMQRLDVVTWEGATYDVSQQLVVVRTGAWHAACSWHGERRLVVLYSRGDWRTLPPWDCVFLHEAAFRLRAGA